MSQTKKFRCKKGTHQNPPKSKNCVPSRGTSKKQPVDKYERILKKYESDLGSDEGDFFIKREIAELIQKMKEHPDLTQAEIYEELDKYNKGHGLFV